MLCKLALRKIFCLPLSLLIVLCVLYPLVAHAEDIVIDDDPENDEASASVVSTINDRPQAEHMVTHAIAEHKSSAFLDEVNGLKVAISTKEYLEDMDKQSPFFLDNLVLGLLTERVSSEQLNHQSFRQLLDTTNQTYLGYTTLVNGTSNASGTSLSATYLYNEASLAQTLDNLFCIPLSRFASADCQAKKDTIKPPYENFVDYFTSVRTWTDQKIFDVLMLDRRFFGSVPDKTTIESDVLDGATIIASQATIARDNLRLSIINEIAARRAPTSAASGDALKIMLSILVPTGDVTSTNYTIACADNMPKTPPVQYVCGLVLSQASNGVTKGFISQAAIDRILDFDYMLSTELYDHIYDVDFVSSNSDLKTEVWLKAQQVAQDYRGLRLLQMKTLATAMNMMNGK